MPRRQSAAKLAAAKAKADLAADKVAAETAPASALVAPVVDEAGAALMPPSGDLAADLANPAPIAPEAAVVAAEDAGAARMAPEGDTAAEPPASATEHPDPDFASWAANPDDWSIEQHRQLQQWLDANCELVAVDDAAVFVRKNGAPMPEHPGLALAIYGRQPPAAEDDGAADLGISFARPVFAGLTVMFREHNRRFNGLTTTPAMITRVYDDLVVNLTVIPDGDVPYPRLAVPFEEVLDPDGKGRAWSFISL
jgi:hypothetical protein